MEKYEGLTENDYKILQIALSKMPITGAEAPMVVKLQQKLQMELDFSKLPDEEKPQKGDILTKN